MKLILKIRWILFPFFLCSLSCKTSHTNKQTSTETNKSIALQIPVYPLAHEKDLDVLMHEISDTRIVLLGEASHGTAEYYNWRAMISKRLIKEKGFNFIAIEGDWADSYRVNNFIKGEKKDSAAIIGLLEHFNRWPTWIWGNYEIASLVSWLNAYNQDKPFKNKVGFFGLDLFSVYESVSDLIAILKDTVTMKMARNIHQCFQPYSHDELQYASAQRNPNTSCQAPVDQFWNSVLKRTSGQAMNEDEFVLEQTARIAVNGERYYHTVVHNRINSWNLRDRHMSETLNRLLQFHGPDSKAIIWAHNTHVADAHYTNDKRNGKLNLAELVRKEYGRSKVFTVGLGSYSGSIIAGEKWGAILKKFDIPPAAEGSWENILHRISTDNKIILTKEFRNNANTNRWINQRAIGAVYYPPGLYVPSLVSECYDAYLFFDKSSALHPIPKK